MFISLRTGGRQTKSTPQAISVYAQRLSETIEADRREVGDRRIDLSSTTRKSPQPLGQGVTKQPSRTKPSLNEPAVTEAAMQPSPLQTMLLAHAAQKKAEAPAPATLISPALQEPKPVAQQSAELIAETDLDSIKRFKQFARLHKLTIARNKTRDGFVSEATTAAYEAWKTSESQARAQHATSLKAMLGAIDARPLVTHGAGHEVGDLTLIVKRLAFLLNKADPSSTLAASAIDYLIRNNLIESFVQLTPIPKAK